MSGTFGYGHYGYGYYGWPLVNMVDPVEVVVRYLRSTPLTLTLGNRIVAGQARYGKGWSLVQSALTVRPSGGTPDLYTPIRSLRLEMRCWGATEMVAWDAYLALAGVAARVNRQRVALTDGTVALLHALLEISGPSLIWDDEVKAWSIVVFYECQVGEYATT